jgi:hypothetical protein
MTVRPNTTQASTRLDQPGGQRRKSLSPRVTGVSAISADLDWLAASELQLVKTPDRVILSHPMHQDRYGWMRNFDAVRRIAIRRITVAISQLS